MKHDRENSPTKASEDPYSQRRHKEQKVLVVSLSNTVINPGTMVVKTLRGESNNKREIKKWYIRMKEGEGCKGCCSQLVRMSHLDTVVTDATVGASWRTVELACLTPLHLHLDTIDINDLVKWLTKIIFLICML